MPKKEDYGPILQKSYFLVRLPRSYLFILASEYPPLRLFINL